MISRLRFHRVRLSHKQTTIVLCSMLILIVITAFFAARLGHAANHRRQRLTFEDRVAAQRAIEEVYHRHRLWPKENPQPKPPLDEVMPEAAIRAKVEDYLRKSTALEVYWQRPVTPEQLQAEMERMAQGSKQPEVLRELWAALGNDPMMIAECLARPALVERLARNWYAADERFHGELRRRAEAELQQPGASTRMRAMSGEYREVEWRLASGEGENPQSEIRNSQSEVLDAERWRERMNKLQRMFGAGEDGVQSTAFRRKGLTGEPLPPEGGTTNAVSRNQLPSGRLSALQEDEERFYALMILEQSAGRVKAVVVEWRKVAFDEWWSTLQGKIELDTTEASYEHHLPEIEFAANSCEDMWKTTIGPPTERSKHTAVWTGSEMIIWGGEISYGTAGVNSGGRYNPATDTWRSTSTTGAPNGRYDHTAVWSGSEMIVWGGYNPNGVFNTGGRYNPVTDSWRVTSITGAPSERSGQTAVWSGSEMIIWGGRGNGALNTGGRYNPTTDSWRDTSTTGVPSERDRHTAVWSGSEMIVWGGSGDNTGGRYNPATDSWRVTSTTGAPSERIGYTAVWSGSEMIVWGGRGNGDQNTGGRYNPTTDTWRTTNTASAPSKRLFHTAVWTGNEMVIWGGYDDSNYVNTGGRYNPTTDTWRITTTTGAPTGRSGSTSVWSGREMIVWGGYDHDNTVNTGGRYNPATDAWTNTSTRGALNGRANHAAIWNGNEMIVWGGTAYPTYFNTGGRYNPATDSWSVISTTNAPSRRSAHTAVWSGSEMIIWGGQESFNLFSNGGRYNPTTNTWQAISPTGAPGGRYAHTAVWSGSEMVVWGGADFPNYFNTGGRYNPATNTWTTTSATGAPVGRYAHTAVWSGNEMIVWGGREGSNLLNSGGWYNPTTDAWRVTNTIGAPSERELHTAVWSGSEMIVWGGRGNGNRDLNTGGRYNPATDSWQATSTTGAPSERSGYTVVWSGSEMIVWGGSVGGYLLLNSGGRYNPVTNIWVATSLTGAPTGRSSHTAVWTGREMIVWGGGSISGAIYTPPSISISISPASQHFQGVGGIGSVNVTVESGCNWTATSNVSWISIISGSSGSGNGTVNYSVAANTTTAPRTGTLAITGQIFTVTQAGCVVSISPTSQSIGFTGGTGSITVTASGSCNWAASSSASWLTITSGSTGNGNGVVSYLVAFNPDLSSRSATLTIAGQPFSISQSGAPEPFGSPLTVDDGTPDDAIGVLGGGTLVGVNRLTPTDYPAKLTHVAIFFNRTMQRANTPFTLFVGANLSGSTNINGIGFQIVDARIRSADNQFNVYAVPNVTLSSGDFVVGLRITHDSGELPFTLDKTPPSRRRSYTSGNGVNFTLIDNLSVPGPGNFMIRAYWDRPPCHRVTNISPASGTAGTSVTITGANFTGVTRVAFANNVAANFTVNSDTQITTTVPSGAVTGPITISRPDCSDVQTGIFALPGYEADIAPRPTGNGAVTAADWAQIGRFVAGLDTPANGSEFQRADCAPRSSLGDGRLTTADWVQAGRYAAGSDPVVAAGGPIAPSGLLASVGAQRRRAAPDGQRPTNGEMRAVRLAQAVAGEFIVEINARGNENALGFSLQFDPGECSFVSAATGRDARSATLHVNASQAALGRIGVVLALGAGQRLPAGARQIVIVRLAARGGRGAIEFSDYPVKREVVDAEANVTPSAFATESAASTAKTPRTRR